MHENYKMIHEKTKSTVPIDNQIDTKNRRRRMKPVADDYYWEWYEWAGVLLALEILYLVEDVLVVLLGSEVDSDAADGSNDTAQATTPEKSFNKSIIVMVEFIDEPAEP